MPALDVPEILIGVGFLVCIVFGIYNWRYSHTHRRT
jgi:hypothetical protein